MGQMAMDTQVDKAATKKVEPIAEDVSSLDAAIMNNCSIDEIEIAPVEVRTDRPAKKKFVIKSNESQNLLTPIVPKKVPAERAEQIKNYIFPSSIRAIGSKVNEPKRYFFKDANIFVNTKSKNELFDEIMDRQTKQSSQATISTAATSKKSQNTDNWYMQDKTKKCVRAMQQPQNEPKTGSYAANLDKNDPGCKRVRFLDDMGLAKTSQEMVLYSGFDDKRDLKAFKRDMLLKNWNEKICGKFE